MDGFVRFERSIVDSAFYRDINCKVLYFHLRLLSTYNSYMFGKHKLQAGQCVSSIRRLASETGLSIKEVRNAIDRLVYYGEIEIRERSKGRYGGTIFTLLNCYERCKEDDADIDFVRKVADCLTLDVYYDITNIAELLHWKRRLRECEMFLENGAKHAGREETKFTFLKDLPAIRKQLERLERKEAFFGFKPQK